MTEPLALKYRPRTFQDIAGQKPIRAVLYQMVRKGRVPRALLLAGPRGSGKTSTARILAAALNCTGWDAADPKSPIPCRTCPSCQAVEDGSSLDLLELDAASSGGIDEVRRLKELTSYAPTGAWRVVLLDEAHAMSRDAFNALLKHLEEPPPRTVFVLVTTDPAKIITTVASRCHRFTFQRLTPAVIAARLRKIADAEGIYADDGLLTAIAERADGALRDAVMTFEQVTSIGLSTAADLFRLHGEADCAPAILAAMASGDHAAIFAALSSAIDAAGECTAVSDALVSCLRDLLVLHAGGETAATGSALAARQQLCESITVTGAVEAMRVLWDLRTRVRGICARASLELAAVVASAKLCPPPREAAPAARNGANGHDKLTPAELRRLAGAT